MKNIFAFTFVTLVISTPALAEIEEVIVWGTDQAYQGNFSALEIPQAELKIDNDTLKDAGAIDLTTALDLSASVARQNNFGGLWNSFAVRGFVGDENLPSNYLVNGFNAGRGFGGSRDLSGIESVEVLKGPRAALFGRGEPGGTINLVTKRPTFETAGELRIAAGSYDTYRTDVDYTTPLSDSLAIRLVGFYEDAESFRDTIETTKQGFSPSLAWKIDDASKLVYELEYTDQEVPFDRGVLAINGQLGLVPESRFLGEPGDGPMQAAVIGHQLEFQHDFNEDWSTLIGYNYRGTSLEGFSTETGFGEIINDEIGRFRRFRDYDATYQVLRAEVTGNFSTGSIKHRVIIGADDDKFENDQVFLRIRNRDFAQEINVFNPVYGAYNLPPPNSNTDRIETQKSKGLFVQDQISFNDKFDLRLGVRYDDYSQVLNNRRNNDPAITQGETRFSPQYGAVYKASESFSVYVAFGKNFRPLSGVDANTNMGFDPNETTSNEVGIKFEINDGALVGTASIFNVEQSNISGVTDITSFNDAAIGGAQSQGIELDLNGEIASGLNLWASYAYVDAEIDEEFNDPNFGLDIDAGSPLLNIPEHQLSLQLVKSTQLSGKPLELGGGLIHVGKRNGYFGVDFDLPSYTSARIFASYDISKAIALRVDIDNLFDTTYYTNSFADVWVQPGTPRNFTASATFTF